MNKAKAALVAIFAILTAGAQATSQTESSWWNETPWVDPDRGFYWYPDPQLDKPVEEKKKEEKKPKTIYEMTSLEEVKKEIDRLKGVAVVNPTEKNVLEFLRAQNWVMDKSSMFADVARRVVWANPEVNYAARSPSTNFARQNDKERMDKRRDELLQQLAQTHGILYFSRSDCVYCLDQGPVLKGFAQKTGMPILAVALDGKPVRMFPDAKPDNGISMIASGGEGIKTVPSMFLVDRKTQQMIPLGSGVIAADELAERIRIMTSTAPGQEF